MSLLKLSEQAASNNHIWTWDNHNVLSTFIHNEAAKQKRTKEVFDTMQCTLKKYDSLFESLSKVNDIEQLTDLLIEARTLFSKKCSTKRLSVYLAGAYDEYNYRASAKDGYGHLLKLFDPIQEHDQKNPDLVELDKQAIRDCDIFVAYVKKYSAGTMMEINFAHSIGKPVYVIAKGSFIQDIWVRHHTTNFFPSIKTCFNYILEEYKIGDQYE